jgi:hypothetical protein
MIPRLGWTLSLALSLASGCASYTALSQEERGRIESQYARSDRPEFLKLSCFVTPFFGDPAKTLLTPVPPDEVRLLEDPSGKPISPGDVKTVLPAGTPVVIDKIEFPTSLAVTERIVYTPRTQPWVYLRVPGAAKAQPLILVLRPNLKSEAEVRAELARYVTEADPAPVLAQWPKSVQEAISRKHALVDMSSQALEMAWGYPERIQRTFEEVGRKETWRYPGGTRKAELLDDRVVDLTP